MDVREEFKKITQIPEFESQVEDKALLETDKMSVLQINVGRLCNLACKQDRKTVMWRRVRTVQK